MAHYYATITHLDHEVGRLVDLLRRRGLYDDTLIVFSAVRMVAESMVDNGLGLRCDQVDSGQVGIGPRRLCAGASVGPVSTSGSGRG